MNITLTRTEGPTEQCNRPFKFGSFLEADVKLKSWSHSAPAEGGYDKCDFTIVDHDAQIEYVGRYDLKHWRVECANLKGHVIHTLEFLAGDSRPAHMTQERYDAYLAKFDQAFRDQAREIALHFKGKN